MAAETRKTRILNARLTPRTARQLASLAKEHRVSRARLIEELIGRAFVANAGGAFSISSKGGE